MMAINSSSKCATAMVQEPCEQHHRKRRDANDNLVPSKQLDRALLKFNFVFESVQLYSHNKSVNR